VLIFDKNKIQSGKLNWIFLRPVIWLVASEFKILFYSEVSVQGAFGGEKQRGLGYSFNLQKLLFTTKNEKSNQH